ncbi:polysaccharide transporter, PST family [Seinonella peptonophila]|uniref:Polysaccharide transporter, PST family n=1 Tax=Seinonella peptonophila TaxID=112248 RepID=A0A1M4YNC9_9BACL|nr:polysaccharide biosynthesis protein [Seinonella peptonophila]SHF07012.1 polysaccharide transporter, PST family [Seinonella peptonophila]
MENVKKSFIKGIAILTIAGFISKLLGAVYRVPYQNMTGDIGIYVYQQVYPIYSLFLILATAGVPVAISKLVSERATLGDTVSVKRIIKISSRMLFVIGLLAFILLFFGADVLATWMGNRTMLTAPIQAVACALLVTPMLSVLRGYFQGYQQMEAPSISQVIEQLMRVITILVSAWFFMQPGYGVVWAGTGAMFGACIGGISGLIVLWWFLRKQHRNEQNVLPAEFVQPSAGTLIKRLFFISLPICISSLAMPLFSLVDSFSIGNLLVAKGGVLQQVILSKGAYDRAQPLIQFASFFATALALSVVPAITNACVRGEQQRAKRRAVLAIRLTLLLGLPGSIGLAVIAEPTNIMLFKDSAGTDALAVLALSTLFSTLASTATGILQGAERIAQPAYYLLIGVVVKIAANIVLIGQWGVVGAAWATVLAFLVVCLLNLWSIRQRFPFQSWGIQWLLRALFSVCIMAVGTYFSLKGFTYLFEIWLPERAAMAFTSLGSVCVGIILYLWAILHLGLLSRVEQALLPKRLFRLMSRSK